MTESEKTIDHIRQDQEARRELSAKLRKTYLADVVVETSDEVFQKAWDEGHAYGESEVMSNYSDLAKIVLNAIERSKWS